MNVNKTKYESWNCLIIQGMEIDDPESRDSDPEYEGQPDSKHLAQKRASGEEELDAGDEEGEESDTEEQQPGNVEEEDWQTCSEDEDEEEGATSSFSETSFRNSSRLLHKDELLDMFKAAHIGPKCKDGQLTVGLVSKNLEGINLP